MGDAADDMRDREEETEWAWAAHKADHKIPMPWADCPWCELEEEGETI